MELGRCLEHEPTIAPDLPEREVAERLASYNMLAVGVATRPAGCSARSPSTTCSTAPCRPAGASAAGSRRPAALRGAPSRRDPPRGPHHAAPARAVRGATTTPRRSAGSASRSPARWAPPGSSSSRRSSWSSGSASTSASVALRWDKYPFILLNLAFCTQAAYAAPLILLAQNRQEQRDRAQTDNDRRVAERTQADTEFLAREIASVRLSLADVATTSEIGEHLERLTEAVERMNERLSDLEIAVTKDEPPTRPRPST